MNRLVSDTALLGVVQTPLNLFKRPTLLCPVSASSKGTLAPYFRVTFDGTLPTMLHFAQTIIDGSLPRSEHIIMLPLAAHIPGCSRCAPLSGWLVPGHTPPSEEPLPRTLARTHAEPPQRARPQLDIHWPLSKTQRNRWFKHKLHRRAGRNTSLAVSLNDLTSCQDHKVVVSYAAEPLTRCFVTCQVLFFFSFYFLV